MNKEKNILKLFIEMGTGTIISMCIGFITTPIITRIVEPSEYGMYSIFTVYTNLSLIILCLGFDQALVRYFYDNKSNSYKQYLLHKCIKAPIIISICIFIIFILLENLNILKFKLGKTVLVLLCISIFIQIIYRFSQLILRLEYNTKLYSLLNVIYKIIYVLSALVLLHIATINDTLSLIISTITAFFICLLISIIKEKKLWFCSIPIVKTYTLSYRELFLYAYPYVFSMGITTLFQTADKLVLDRYGTYSDVGIYTSAMTLISLFAVIQNSFNSLWTPIAVEHFSNNSEDKTFYRNGNQIITLIMFLIGLTLILSKDIFAILLGEKYRQAAYILPFLVFEPIMYTISETTISGLIFMKKSKLQVIIAIGACFCNILGNLYLVPRLGGQGAAISTGISYIIFFMLRTQLSNKYYYIDFGLKKFYILTFFTVIYAMYNTFYSFNIITILGYFVCLGLLLFLYKDTLKWTFKYLINLIPLN